MEIEDFEGKTQLFAVFRPKTGLKLLISRYFLRFCQDFRVFRGFLRVCPSISDAWLSCSVSFL